MNYSKNYHPSESLVHKFISEIYEKVDETEPVLINLYDKNSKERKYYFEIIDYFISFYRKIRTESLYFRFENLYNVAYEVERFFKIHKKELSGFTSDEILLLIRTQGFLRRIMANIGIYLKDEGFETESGKIREQFSKIKCTEKLYHKSKTPDLFDHKFLISFCENIQSPTIFS